MLRRSHGLDLIKLFRDGSSALEYCTSLISHFKKDGNGSLLQMLLKNTNLSQEISLYCELSTYLELVLFSESVSGLFLEEVR